MTSFVLTVKYVLTLFMVLTMINAAGQTLQDVLSSGETNFVEIVNSVESYYSENPEAKGRKQYERWKHHNHTRLDQNGNIQNTGLINFNAAVAEAQEQNKKLNLPGGDWSTIGADESHAFSGSDEIGVGRINCIAVDPDNSNTIYVGTPQGGVWRANSFWQGNHIWVPLTDGLTLSIGISSIVIADAPSGNNPIYVLTGDADGWDAPYMGVLVSYDNGDSWFGTSLMSPSYNSSRTAHKLIVDPNDHQTLYALIGDEVYKTTDGFLTNTLVLSGLSTFTDIEFKPGSSDDIYVCNRRGVWKTTDAGNNWSQLTTGLPTYVSSMSRVEMAVTADNPEVLYVLYGQSSGSLPDGEMYGLYRSTNSGTSFSLRSDSPNLFGYDKLGGDDLSQAWYDMAIAVNPQDADEVFVGGIDIWNSTDGGSTWSNSAHWIHGSSGTGYAHADVHDLFFVGPSPVLLAGTDGGISSLWTPFTKTAWNQQWDGLTISQAYRIGKKRGFTTSPASGWHFGSQDNGTHFVNDNNNNGHRFSGGDGFECFSRDNRWYASVQYGKLYRFANNSSVSRTTITPTNYNGNNNGPWLTPYNFDPSDEQVMVVAYVGDVYRSVDGGDNWNMIGAPSDFVGSANTDAEHIAIAESNSDVIYVAFGSRLYQTANLGVSWTQLPTTFSNRVITYFSIDPNNADHLWVSVGSTMRNVKVFESTDGGNNWNNISEGLPNVSANCVIHDQQSTSGGIYVGTDIGVYYRDNNLGEWMYFSNGLPNAEVTELEIEQEAGTVVAGTYGRGLWESPLYGRDCLGNLTFLNTTIHEGKRAFDVLDNITSSARLENFADIKYRAGNFVLLEPGFDANSVEKRQQKLDARISPACQNLILKKGRAKPVTGTYAGLMPGLVDNTGLMDVPTGTNTIELYPNPTSDFLTVELEMGTSSEVDFFLYDANGRMVFANWPRDRTFEEGSNRFNLKTNHLQPGIYFLRAASSNGTLVKSFTKE